MLMIPVIASAADKTQNLMVWGTAACAEDGKWYYTLYKNNPATAEVEFHFRYDDRKKSEHYYVTLADTVARFTDPVPVEKPVREVVIDAVNWSVPTSDGTVYRTTDAEDPLLESLLIDMFDIYSDLFYFDVYHRARYYDSHPRMIPDSSVAPDHSSRGGNRSFPSLYEDEELDMTKLSEGDLIAGIVAVGSITAGMVVMVSDAWNVPDERFPYFSVSPQIQYFVESGNMRDVVQFKYRMGEKGGWSLLADLGHTAGSLREDCFDPGLTWSFGVGLDLGPFSTSLRMKPSLEEYRENFCTFQASYDFFVTRHMAIDVSGGIGFIRYSDDLYLDFPLSLGLLIRF